MTKRHGPLNPDSGKELSRHFLGKDGKLHEESSLELPDVKKVDAEMRRKLREKFEAKKNESINRYKFKNEVYMLIKLIGSIVALIIAMLFVFVFPGAGAEGAVVAIVTSIATQLGLVSWRKDYDLFKAWFKSKTIVGSLVVVVPLIALAVINFFAIAVPVWVIYVLGTLIVLGGGTSLKGIFDAIRGTSSTPVTFK